MIRKLLNHLHFYSKRIGPIIGSVLLCSLSHADVDTAYQQNQRIHDMQELGLIDDQQKQQLLFKLYQKQRQSTPSEKHKIQLDVKRSIASDSPIEKIAQPD